jgi:lipopolysaccharide transport system permease protein
MYATPIVYPAALVPEWLRPFYNLNPMVGIIESYREI